MARNKRNTDRFSGGKAQSCLGELHFQPLPAQWMLLTDGRGKSSFLTSPILLAGSNPQLPMKKFKPQPSNVCPLLDEETKTSVRNLLFGPKVLKRLAILARLARGAKADGTVASSADDERLAA